MMESLQIFSSLSKSKNFYFYNAESNHTHQLSMTQKYMPIERKAIYLKKITSCRFSLLPAKVTSD